MVSRSFGDALPEMDTAPFYPGLQRRDLSFEAGARRDVPLWPKITASTIVIQGNKDTLVPKENAEFAKKVMVNAPVKVITLEDMNHFVPWTHPYLIRDAILEMIRTIKSSKES